MIARFLQEKNIFKESIVLEKNIQKLNKAIDDIDNIMVSIRKGQGSLSDQKSILWFRKKNNEENILCLPFVHYYKDSVTDYIGIYNSYDNSTEQQEEFDEKSFGFLIKQDDTEGKKRSSNFARKLIRKLSALPDYDSMKKELDRVSEEMFNFDWNSNKFI